MIEICYNDIISIENLNEAYSKVIKKNKYDKVDIRIEDLHFDLKNAIYKPEIVKIIDNKKNIGIVNLKDKLVQIALCNFLNKYVEKDAIPSNFGYLRDKSIYQASDYINNMIDNNNINFFYKLDIKGFFNSINHDILIKKLKDEIKDNKVCNLIIMFIKIRYTKSGRIYNNNRGLLLGNPISPLLSNLYMKDFDAYHYNEHSLYVRFSDDILIGSTNTITEDKKGELVKRLLDIDLEINEDKSGFLDIKKGFVFLGVSFKRNEEQKEDNYIYKNINIQSFREFYRYSYFVENITEEDIQNIYELIKDKEDIYLIPLLIIIVRNKFTIDKEILNNISDHLNKADIELLIQVIKKSDKNSLITNLIDFFIEKGNFVIADKLTKIDDNTILNEENNSNEDEDLLNRYLELFQGRKGVYARGYSDINGNRYYYKVNNDFTNIELSKMLEDRISCGFYPLNENNKSCVVVFDIDISKKGLLVNSEDSNYFNNMLNKTFLLAKEIKRILFKLNLISYIEFSGYKGYHVWLFFRYYIDIEDSRDLFYYIKNSIVIDKGINIELFPSEKNQIIKYPLSYHELSNNQSVFYNDNNEAIDNQLEYISSFRLNNGIIINDLINKSAAKEEKQKNILNNLNDYPKYITNIYYKCNLIKIIVDKAINENYLNHFERNALLYIFGHTGEKGRKFIHFIISKCINYDYEVSEGFISRMKENPVSCNKLKSRFPHICESIECDCNFSDFPLFYSSPVIHGYMINKEAVTKPEVDNKGARLREISKVSEKVKLNALARTLLDLRKKKKEIDTELSKVYEELELFFINKNINEYEVDIGKLIMKENEWYIKI